MVDSLGRVFSSKISHFNSSVYRADAIEQIDRVVIRMEESIFWIHHILRNRRYVNVTLYSSLRNFVRITTKTYQIPKRGPFFNSIYIKFFSVSFRFWTKTISTNKSTVAGHFQRLPSLALQLEHVDANLDKVRIYALKPHTVNSKYCVMQYRKRSSYEH